MSETPSADRRSLGIRLGLERVRALRARHSPQQDPFAPTWRTIHVAGTKGKGSTTEFIRRLLLAAGFRVGAFFSPFVRDPGEQVQIGGAPVPADEFAAAVARLEEDATALGATEFEVLTAAAFLLFDENAVDYAVVEVGVGGREDATNILQNTAVSVLTPIGLDHQDLLGSTIEEIAGHKAGILRPHTQAVVHVPDAAAHAVITAEAETLAAPIWDVRWQPAEHNGLDRFSVQTPLGLRTDLQAGMPGPFQRANAATAVTVVDLLAALGQFPPLSNETVQGGLLAARLPGRYEEVPGYPMRVIADGAHNALSAGALADALHKETFDRLYLIVGMKYNHDPDTFLAPLAALRPAGLVATAPVGPNRGQVHPPERIAQAARHAGIPVLGVAPTVKEAVSLALVRLTPADLLCICGSFVLVGDVDASHDRNPA